MEKPTIPVSYRFGEDRVEPMPYFLYEVSIYKITKNMASLMDSQLYKSDKVLKVRNDITVKKYRAYSIVRYVTILGVTKEFVEENDLPIYKKKLTKRKKK